MKRRRVGGFGAIGKIDCPPPLRELPYMFQNEKGEAVGEEVRLNARFSLVINHIAG